MCRVRVAVHVEQRVKWRGVAHRSTNNAMARVMVHDAGKVNKVFDEPPLDTGGLSVVPDWPGEGGSEEPGEAPPLW